MSCSIQISLSSSFPPPDHKATKGRRGESKGRTTKAEILTSLLPSANTTSSSPNLSATPVPQIWEVSVIFAPLRPHSYLPALTRSSSGRSPLLKLPESCSPSTRAGTHGCCRLILCCRKGGCAPFQGSRRLPKPFPTCLCCRTSADFQVPPPSLSLLSQSPFPH